MLPAHAPFETPVATPRRAIAQVLHVANSVQMGGVNRFLLTLVPELRRRGTDALIVCPSDGPMISACREESAPAIVMPFTQPTWKRPLRTWLAERRWMRLMRRHNTSLVHVHDPYSARPLLRAAKKLGLPVVCHLHFPLDVEMVSWVFRGLPWPDLFAFCSEGLMTQNAPLLERYFPGVPHRVIHNGVDTARFTPGRRRDAGVPRLGVVANLLPVKGHEDLLVAVADLVHRRGLAVEVCVVGEDVLGSGWRGHLEQKTRDLRLEAHVRFLGHRSDVPELIRDTDIVVCPSRVEPFGLCLIEAMATEKPVVATKVGGIPEIVVDQVTGLLVEASRPDQLADALETLLENPELARAMGEAGRDRVFRCFTKEVFTERNLEIYRELL